MNIFATAVEWTVKVGIALMGVYIGLCLLQAGISVAAWLVTSWIGILILLLLFYAWWRRNKDKL